jgi:hypothetical protein
MDYFSGIFGITAVDSAIQKSENQITFENFVVLAEKQGVLAQNETCASKVDKDKYLDLYDALVDADIITKKANAKSVFTWESSYVVSSIIDLGEENLMSILEKKKPHLYVELIKCFNIDFKKLSTLLSTYKYNPTDQFEIMKTGGKGATSKSKKRRRTRKKTCKKKSTK